MQKYTSLEEFILFAREDEFFLANVPSASLNAALRYLIKRDDDVSDVVDSVINELRTRGE